MTVVRVLTEKPYDVVVGHDLVADIAASIPDDVHQVAILHAPALRQHAETIAAAIAPRALLIQLADGEAAKSYQQLEKCWDALGAEKFTRSDLIISVGGGATTDLAGFVAASWLRGIRVIHVPTTLLAMVDAAVGGKTGINTSAGKNLVGAFHHPTAVFCDLDLLATLPHDDVRAGFGEIIKCGFISDAHILSAVEQFGEDLLDWQHPAFEEIVTRAISVKAVVVADDFTESKPGGLGREILNYGHTFGHAIEKCENYATRHGEAISIGMIYVAELAQAAGMISEEVLATHRNLISSLGLPTTYTGASFDELVDAMSIDKKARGATLRFIVLSDLQKPAVLSAPTEEQLRHAYDQVRG